MPMQWYKKQGRLAETNQLRKTWMKSCSENNRENMICMERSHVKGSLLENKMRLLNKMTNADNENTINHLRVLIEIIDMLMERGPIVATQDIRSYYSKRKKCSRQGSSSCIYNILSRHLNIVQIYLNGKAFIIENTGSNIEALLDTIESTVSYDKIVNARIEERLLGVLKQALDYTDSPRDKQIIKGLLAQLTTIKQASKLQGLQSRKGTRAANRAPGSGLTKFKNIKHTSQIVRNDLTNAQQYRVTNRIITVRKMKEIRVIREGRGRKHKIKHFPQLR